MDLIVLDLSTLRYRWNAAKTALAATTALGEVVSVVDTAPGLDAREAAFLACDAALARGRLLRAAPEDPARTRTYRLALYNPYSAETSVGAVPDTQVFCDRRPLALELGGSVAHLADGRLLVGGRILSPVEESLEALAASYQAHRAAQ